VLAWSVLLTIKYVCFTVISIIVCRLANGSEQRRCLEVVWVSKVYPGNKMCHVEFQFLGVGQLMVSPYFFLSDDFFNRRPIKSDDIFQLSFPHDSNHLRLSASFASVLCTFSRKTGVTVSPPPDGVTRDGQPPLVPAP